MGEIQKLLRLLVKGCRYLAASPINFNLLLVEYSDRDDSDVSRFLLEHIWKTLFQSRTCHACMNAKNGAMDCVTGAVNSVDLQGKRNRARDHVGFAALKFAYPTHKSGYNCAIVVSDTTVHTPVGTICT